MGFLYTGRVAVHSPARTISAFVDRGIPLHNQCMGDLDSVAVERGTRLKRCRRAMDWTQGELAEATGWSQQTTDKGLSPSRIANFEQGTRRVGHEEAQIFEQVFGLPAAYFMALLDPKEAEVVAALRGLRMKVPLDQAG
jgi:transcriptional regulator with XRE-family HTH domain